MDTEAFEQAVEMHKDRVHGYARLILRDSEEARDVVQESMIRLWQRRRQVDREGARLWLMRTTHNLCIDRIRKRKVRSEIDEGDKVIPLRPDCAPGPGQLAQASELGQQIERALDNLTPRDRAVVVLREVQGLPYDEIAQVMEMPLGTLKARLHRARERLRASLVRAGVTP